jgi:hypothetical protein
MKERRGGGHGVGSQTAWLGQLRAALSEAIARTRARGGLADRGGRQGVGDVGRWDVSVTDMRDWGEAGPGGQWPGCERERETEAGWQWGADMWARVAQCRVAWFKLDLNRFKI